MSHQRDQRRRSSLSTAGGRLKRLFTRGGRTKEDYQVFGKDLTEAVSLTCLHDAVPLPAVFRRCLFFIQQHGLDEEGVYRRSAVSTQVTRLKAAFDTRGDVKLESYFECGGHNDNKEASLIICEASEQDNDSGVESTHIHTAASLLKQYLRNLPEGPLTDKHQPSFEEVLTDTAIDDAFRVDELKLLLSKLPRANFYLLGWLIKHFVHLLAHTDNNLMTMSGLYIVFAPALRICQDMFTLFVENADELFENVELRECRRRRSVRSSSRSQRRGSKRLRSSSLTTGRPVLGSESASTDNVPATPFGHFEGDALYTTALEHASPSNEAMATTPPTKGLQVALDANSSSFGNRPNGTESHEDSHSHRGASMRSAKRNKKREEKLQREREKELARQQRKAEKLLQKQEKAAQLEARKNSKREQRKKSRRLKKRGGFERDGHDDAATLGTVAMHPSSSNNSSNACQQQQQRFSDHDESDQALSVQHRRKKKKKQKKKQTTRRISTVALLDGDGTQSLTEDSSAVEDIASRAGSKGCIETTDPFPGQLTRSHDGATFFSDDFEEDDGEESDNDDDEEDEEDEVDNDDVDLETANSSFAEPSPNRDGPLSTTPDVDDDNCVDGMSTSSIVRERSKDVTDEDGGPGDHNRSNENKGSSSNDEQDDDYADDASQWTDSDGESSSLSYVNHSDTELVAAHGRPPSQRFVDTDTESETSECNLMMYTGRPPLAMASSVPDLTSLFEQQQQQQQKSEVMDARLIAVVADAEVGLPQRHSSRNSTANSSPVMSVGEPFVYGHRRSSSGDDPPLVPRELVQEVIPLDPVDLSKAHHVFGSTHDLRVALSPKGSLSPVPHRQDLHQEHQSRSPHRRRRSQEAPFEVEIRTLSPLTQTSAPFSGEDSAHSNRFPQLLAGHSTSNPQQRRHSSDDKDQSRSSARAAVRPVLPARTHSSGDHPMWSSHSHGQHTSGMPERLQVHRHDDGVLPRSVGSPRVVRNKEADRRRLMEKLQNLASGFGDGDSRDPCGPRGPRDLSSPTSSVSDRHSSTGSRCSTEPSADDGPVRQDAVEALLKETPLRATADGALPPSDGPDEHRGRSRGHLRGKQPTSLRAPKSPCRSLSPKVRLQEQLEELEKKLLAKQKEKKERRKSRRKRREESSRRTAVSEEDTASLSSSSRSERSACDAVADNERVPETSSVAPQTDAPRHASTSLQDHSANATLTESDFNLSVLDRTCREESNGDFADDASSLTPVARSTRNSAVIGESDRCGSSADLDLVITQQRESPSRGRTPRVSVTMSGTDIEIDL